MLFNKQFLSFVCELVILNDHILLVNIDKPNKSLSLYSSKINDYFMISETDKGLFIFIDGRPHKQFENINQLKEYLLEI